MAGAAGLEPVTSAVTGQRSNQLSYAPAMGRQKLKEFCQSVKFCFRPACWHPNHYEVIDVDDLRT